MLLFLILIIGLIIYGLVEASHHLSNVKKIPIRIQVNGTRGKSSVTRLIAGGLRANGMKVIAKTTGTKPRFIISDTQEEQVKRLGKANIGEELKIFRQAVKYNPQALVIECMALIPIFQKIDAHWSVRPTHGVITNARADHLDVMGPTVKDVAIALSNTVPKHAKFYTAEHAYLDIFKKKAEKLGTEVFVSSPDSINDEDMKGFSYIEHKENVALALMVCKEFGVKKDTALQGMYRTNPDPGVMRVYHIKDQGKDFRLVNTLAANDPDSILQLWEKFKDMKEEKIVLVNCRDDRPDRSIQLGELVAQKFQARWYVATGQLTMAFVKKAVSSGIPKDKIVDLGNKTPAEIYNRILELVDKPALIFATGNTVGFGETIIEYFARKGGEIDY
jgi:poly-gamma-glutamate synthase PgsB/CapB